MPLRDHFHPPLVERRHWEGFHNAWVNTILRHLVVRLPPRYFAEPQVQLGVRVEVDVATFEEETAQPELHEAGNGVATAVWTAAQPTQQLAVAIPSQDLFEVRVRDSARGSRLVAAVELVSPGNKDRPESRRAFAVKCASYLQALVSVVIIDIVTERHDDLFTELLGLLRQEAGHSWPGEPPLYTVALRNNKPEDKWRLETWEQPLAVGQPLPTMPLWLAANLAIPLELEASYEETCRVLRIV